MLKQSCHKINNKKTMFQTYDTLSQKWMRSASRWLTAFEGGTNEFLCTKVKLSLAGFVPKYKTRLFLLSPMSPYCITWEPQIEFPFIVLSLTCEHRSKKIYICHTTENYLLHSWTHQILDHKLYQNRQLFSHVFKKPRYQIAFSLYQLIAIIA